jgi:hypothetical protein
MVQISNHPKCMVFVKQRRVNFQLGKFPSIWRKLVTLCQDLALTRKRVVLKKIIGTRRATRTPLGPKFVAALKISQRTHPVQALTNMRKTFKCNTPTWVLATSSVLARVILSRIERAKIFHRCQYLQALPITTCHQRFVRQFSNTNRWANQHQWSLALNLNWIQVQACTNPTTSGQFLHSKSLKTPN